MNGIRRFFFGKLDNMDYPSFKWWNSKRIEYNARFIGCLFFAQLLFLIVSFRIGTTEVGSLLERIMRVAMTDAIMIIFVNIIFFIWPLLEKVFVRKSKQGYRKVSFAFLNSINALMVLGALFVVANVRA